MKNIDKEDNAALVKALRDVARRYFDGALAESEKKRGLCFALQHDAYDYYVSYQFWYTLRHELRLLTYRKRWLCPPGRQWEARAMFALVLAEYLENVQ